MAHLRLVLLTPDKVADEWHKVSHLIREWLRHVFGEFGPEDIRQKLLLGEFQCWYTENGEVRAVAITAITPFPGKKIMQVVGLAGYKREEWLHMLEEIEDFARQNGCDRITSCGRPGWSKVLCKYGFTDMYRVMGKEL